MSLRWIYENLEPPNCDEECSDIDDSCSDGSLDSDVADTANNNVKSAKAERETRRHPTTSVTIHQNGKPYLENESTEDTDSLNSSKLPELVVDDTIQQSSKLKLFSRTGYFIGITPSGRVKGFPANSASEIHERLIIYPISTGLVRLQSVETGYYLAFNCTGHLYGEMKIDKDNTEWEHCTIGEYEAFRSLKYADWWLGIKRNGRPKPGPKTAWGQKATQFVTIRLA